ncbi:NADPH-dependent FMN reductase [Bradyrhizobium denitrificans]|uniref:NADPH-dependent FMN reductase n=1 Tax=Bradyrhizobium denitrificans TaxID=2734912 RepID=UPI001557156C|nr:NAD(P)H-dependent oxidoreductase [Bradyrhizobium sp. LMG 8443]NPU25231.1 NAD(P)H-dependent oxidoreductase [Bradyrhizobium sp. LMG 8443]
MARTVAIIVGSIRKESINLKLAKALVKLAPNDFDCDFIRIDDLPVYNQDLDQSPPEAVSRTKSQIAAAKALLFVTPEHNRSLPTALKNVLDWVSRPYGKNLWAGKPAGIAGASIGAIGTAVAQAHLRSVLGYLDVPTLGQPEVYIHFSQGLVDEDGNITNESTKSLLQNFVKCYAEWISKYS